MKQHRTPLCRKLSTRPETSTRAIIPQIVPQRLNSLLLIVSIALLGAVATAAPSNDPPPAKAEASKASSAPQLSFQLRKVRNAKGKVGCALFNGPSGYPMKPEKAYRRLWCPIVNHKATCSVSKGLPSGTYAAVCIHDENGNGKLDTNWIGIPKEGVVASNHAKGILGPPSFKAAAFSVSSKPKIVHMRIGY